MSGIEKLKIKISMPKDTSEFRIPNKKKIHLHDVISWLKSKGYPEDIEAELIQKVSSMPDGTYYSFAKNLRGYAAAIQKRKIEERNSDNNSSEVSNEGLLLPRIEESGSELGS